MQCALLLKQFYSKPCLWLSSTRSGRPEVIAPHNALDDLVLLNWYTNFALFCMIICICQLPLIDKAVVRVTVFIKLSARSIAAITSTTSWKCQGSCGKTMDMFTVDINICRPLPTPLHHLNCSRSCTLLAHLCMRCCSCKSAAFIAQHLHHD